jgi:YHS domain-containing protein
MKPASAPKDTEYSHPGETACGARILITSNTPSLVYQGEIVYFCGEDCRQQFTEDPLNSCLASRLLSGN